MQLTRMSPGLCAAPTDAWGLLGLLFIVMILPAPTPLPAQAIRQDATMRQTWRVVEDAPYRVVPAHPPLEANGETLEELGFDSIPELLSSIERQESISSVAISSDDRFIASGASDNTVKVWDLRNKALIHSFEGHTARVTSVALSSDDRLIASGAFDNTVKVWDLRNKALIHSFEGHTAWVRSVALSSDDRFIASGSSDDTVKVWDLQNKTLIHSFEGHTKPVSSVAFSSDDRFIASGAFDNTVKVWDLQNKTLIHSFEGHTEGHAAWVHSVAISSDDRFIASGTGDGTVTVWDLQNKTLIHSFEGHTGSVLSVAISSDDRFVASGADDGTVKVWDLQNKTLIHSFEGHTGSVLSVAISSDDRFIASGTGDGTVKVWDLQNKILIHSFEGHTDWVTSVAISSDDRFVASGTGDGTVKVWDLQNKTLIHSFEGHTGSVTSVAISSDDRFIASGTGDGTVKVWDLQNKTLIHSFGGHTGSVTSVAISSDDRFIVSGTGDGTVKVWDLQNKTLIHSFEGHTRPVLSVAISSDDRFIVSGASDNTVKVWDLQNKTLIHSFEGHTGSVLSVAISSDDRFIASGASDNTVKVWDLQDKTLIHSFEGHGDLQEKTLVQIFAGHTDSVNSVAISSDDRSIASGADDGTVKVWDLQNKTLIHSLEGHTRPVLAVAISSDDRFIVSGASDNTVKVWDLQNKKELCTLVSGNSGNWLSIDKQQQVLRGDDGSLLKKRATNQANWQPVPVPDMGAQDDFSISVDPNSMTLPAGKTKAVHIDVKNNGSHPAYWLRLKSSEKQAKMIRIDPPNPLFEGRGPQEWTPMRIARLDPGEMATLHGRIALNLKFPATLVKPEVHPVELVVESASGTQVSQTISAEVQAPYLEWQRARLEGDRKTLKIDLYNSGNAALRNFTLGLSASDPNDPNTPLFQVPVLEPASGREVAFVLPEGFDIRSQSLTLQGRTLDLPVFSWELPAPDIERAVRWLYWIMTPLLLLIMMAVFYLYRYRHPLVVQLSGNPRALLQLPPEQLQEAHTRLQQTQRLAKIMSEAEVTPHTFAQAMTFTGERNPEAQARWLAKRLGTTAKCIQPALWELELPESFPLNLDRCLIYFTATAPAADLFDDLNAIEQIRMRVTVLIGPNSAYQRRLHDKTKDRTNKLVAPSGPELTRLLLDPHPDTVLATILADQLTLTQLSPYQLGGGVNRESVFFGRREIIAHIMNRDPANYLVVSGRQLGKSSLLKALERRYQEQPDISCRYLVLSSEVLVPRMASELGLARGAGLEEIADHLAKREGRFLFLIDEADKFIRYERETDYQVLDVLRRMSEEGHCTFILAGFWELYEHAVLDYQSPLKNFAEIVTIGALETEACCQLAALPMQNMRLEYADPALVDQLLESTGQRANLMAITCHQILTQLRPNQRIIEAGDIQRALHSEKTLNALKGWDALTDDEHACRLDRIVVYATVDQERFDLAELVALLNNHNLKPDGHQLDHSLARLELGFVLGRDDTGGYFYRVPLFREMIMKDDPGVRLKVELDVCR